MTTGTEDQKSKSKIVIVDLDGTIADCRHRQHHVQVTPEEKAAGKKKSWPSFFREMTEDPVNEPLNEVLRALNAVGYDIFFVTARPSNYQDKTVTWLYNKAGWASDEYEIYMRAAGDYRPDNIVKQEILDAIREEGREILVIFDDRKSVVDMWRANNLFTCQVADHNF